jgi:hypothetical protein
MRRRCSERREWDGALICICILRMYQCNVSSQSMFSRREGFHIYVSL